ncbi:MAG: hypothetical protein AAF281_09920 [Pseudomonadota bacterium]
MSVEVMRLATDFTVEVVPPDPLPPALARAVDRHWQQATAAAPLWDGPLYTLIDATPARLLIRRAAYRHLIAARAGVRLGLRPLAVTGLLFCPDGLVLGRRSDRVAADPRVWEPVPAGGLARPDPVEQIFEELTEELGLSPSDIGAPSALGLVTARGVSDVVFRLETTLAAGRIEAAFQALTAPEHDAVEIVARRALPAFLAERPCLPALAPMLALDRGWATGA